MSWTDERIALLKKLWVEGRTAAQIAEQLGGISRNAVIGKAHRLNLSNRASPIEANDAAPTKAKAKTVVAPAKNDNKVQKPAAPEKKPATVIKKTGGIKMTELREKMCRWPMGDPRESSFRFCGDHSEAGSPYCADHVKMAYQTVSKARVLNAADFEEKGVVLAEDDLQEAVSA
jgi:GcrA cell cycle regulator